MNGQPIGSAYIAENQPHLDSVLGTFLKQATGETRGSLGTLTQFRQDGESRCRERMGYRPGTPAGPNVHRGC